jgi:hypothetical protein
LKRSLLGSAFNFFYPHICLLRISYSGKHRCKFELA